jgi:cytochrome b6-f complex iron-sulfur subunit
MDRKEFLTLIGFSTGGIILTSCLGACNQFQASPTVTPLVVDFTLNLSDPANSVLKNIGGYLINNGVIVAHATTGNYIAVAAACTHQGQNVQYITSSNSFYCFAHSSSFTNTGAVTGGPASANLQQMKTTLIGTSLRVQS